MSQYDCISKKRVEEKSVSVCPHTKKKQVMSCVVKLEKYRAGPYRAFG
jgi:hypothetical protein